MDDLSLKLKQSLSLSFFDKYVGYFLRFVSTIVVARLVSPDDVGIFSVAFVIISLGHVIRDFGVAQYLIKEAEINHEKIVAAFTLMLIISWTIFGMLNLGRSWIAHFYGHEDINEALSILSLIFLLAPFGSVRIALLRREMDFRSLAKINIFSYVALHAVTIYMAVRGWGYAALAWGQIAGVLATILGTFFYSKLPVSWPSLKGVKAVMRFGANISATNVAETIGSGSPDLILGRVLNMEAVGFFGRAQGLISLFKIAVQAAVWPVVLPYFSGKQRAGLSIVEDYSKAICYYTAFAFPFLIVLGIASPLIITVLFSEVWLPAAPLVKYLCLGAIFEAILPFMGPYLVAQGLEHLGLKLQCANAGFIFFALLIGSLFSIEMAAIGFLVAQMISTWISFFYLKKYTGLTFSLLLAAITKNTLMMVLLGFITFGILQLPIVNVYMKFTLMSMLLTFSWFTMIWTLNHPLKNFLTIKKMKRSMA